jgi:hypothetical protein
MPLTTTSAVLFNLFIVISHSPSAIHEVQEVQQLRSFESLSSYHSCIPLQRP